MSFVGRDRCAGGVIGRARFTCTSYQNFLLMPT